MTRFPQREIYGAAQLSWFLWGSYSPPHLSWPLSPRQMGDKPPLAGPAQQEGMAGWGRDEADHPSLLQRGKLLGATGGPPRATRKSMRPPGGRKPPRGGVPHAQALPRKGEGPAAPRVCVAATTPGPSLQVVYSGLGLSCHVSVPNRQMNEQRL